MKKIISNYFVTAFVTILGTMANLIAYIELISKEWQIALICLSGFLILTCLIYEKNKAMKDEKIENKFHRLVHITAGKYQMVDSNGNLAHVLKLEYELLNEFTDKEIKHLEGKGLVDFKSLASQHTVFMENMPN
jgi:hypothetical protein